MISIDCLAATATVWRRPFGGISVAGGLATDHVDARGWRVDVEDVTGGDRRRLVIIHRRPSWWRHIGA